ncbi:hypothetical protein Syun_023576 [Stephania yunnanensis]|uniref:F-box domain-containing protein n=1 Tax=Stephania yunnanensis TaxID=152371 RepID=A0AAP0I3J0_9MAGN
MERLPQEIVFDIITRLPIASLLRFKCVCKAWLSIAEDLHLLHLYHQNTAQNNRCLDEVLPFIGSSHSTVRCLTKWSSLVPLGLAKTIPDVDQGSLSRYTRLELTVFRSSTILWKEAERKSNVCTLALVPGATAADIEVGESPEVAGHMR